MEDEPYTVVEIVGTLDTRETRGAREKFWIRFNGEAERWLLKLPRPQTGEHWAEKVAFEVGHLIGVDCAQVELARYHSPVVSDHEEVNTGDDRQFVQEAQLATICKSFLPDEQGAGWADSAFHGWEVLQFEVPGYDTERVRGQRDHNIKNITRVLFELMTDHQDNPMPGREHRLEQMVSYALLDGLIGNTDRHHENWMVAYVPEGSETVIKSMPSFDHASSLGRELTDDRRRQYLESNKVLEYLRKGRGGVYVNSRREPAPSPLSLAQLLSRWRPEYTRRTLERIENLSEGQIWTAVERVPREFMSGLAKEFAAQVVTTSRQELLRSAR